MDIGQGEDSIAALASIPTGPELCVALASIDVSSLDGFDAVLVMQAWYRQDNYLQGRLLQAVQQVLVEQEKFGPPNGGRDIYAFDEVGAALTLTRKGSGDLCFLAHDLSERMPAVMRAMLSGRLDRVRARIFSEWTADLAEEHTAAVLNRLLPTAHELTSGELIGEIKKLVIALDPEWMVKRYLKKVKERRVSASRNPEGTANLSGLDLPVDRVALAHGRIGALARAAKSKGHPDTLQRLQADIFLGLTDGLFMGMTDQEIVATLLATGSTDEDDGRGGGPTSKPGGDGEPSTDRTAPEPGPGDATANKDSSSDTTAGQAESSPDGGATTTDDDSAEPSADRAENEVSQSSGVCADINPRFVADTNQADGEGSLENTVAGGHGNGAAQSDGPSPGRAVGQDPDGGPGRADESTNDSRPDSGNANPDSGCGAPIGGPDEVSLAERRPDRSVRPPGNPYGGFDPNDLPLVDNSRIGANAGLRLWIALSTLIGCDRRPSQLAGMGPVHAELARDTALNLRSWWVVLTDPKGRTPIAIINVKRRPTDPRPLKRRYVGEAWIQVTAKSLAELAAFNDEGWAPVINEILTRLKDAEHGPPNDDPTRRLPKTELRRWLAIRDGTCVFKGCRVPAHRSDVDHTQEHAKGGKTVDADLGYACRHHHGLKTEGGWTLTQTEPGHFDWLSRLGHTYRRTPPPGLVEGDEKPPF